MVIVMVIRVPLFDPATVALHDAERLDYDYDDALRESERGDEYLALVPIRDSLPGDEIRVDIFLDRLR